MQREQDKKTADKKDPLDQFYRKPKEDKQEQRFFKDPGINQLFLDEIYNTDARALLEYLAKGGTIKDWFGTTDDTIEVSYIIAKKLYEADQYGRALIEFLRLSALNPYDSRFFLGVGHCHMMLKEYKEAYENYHYAVIYNSKELRPYFFAAEAALKMEDDNSLDYARHFYKEVVAMCEAGIEEADAEEMLEVAKTKLEFLNKRSQEN